MDDVKVASKVLNTKNLKLSNDKQELFLKLLNAKVDRKRSKIERVDRAKALPLSLSQERLWFISQLDDRASRAYHVPVVLGLKGKLDRGVLNRVFATLLERHEILRTNIRTDKQGEPFQIIQENASPEIDCYSLDEHGGMSDESYNSLVREIVSKPFDLSKDRLIRMTLIEIEEDVYSLVIVQHHIVTDGWSIKILVDELAILYTAYYQKECNPLTDLPIQFADYASWQRSWLQQEVLDKESAFWREQLRDAQAVELPSDRPRLPTPSYAGAWTELKVDENLTRSLKALGRKHGCTLYMTLLAVFNFLLNRYTDQKDICIGTPIANRLNSEIEPVIGFFVNILVIRTRVDSHQTFAELLSEVKAATLSSYDHQVMPFEQVVKEVDPGRSQALSPLFQVMFILQNYEGDPPEMSELKVEWERVIDCGISKLDLTMELQETRQGSLVGGIEYSTDLYDAQTMERLKCHYLKVLRAVVDSPEVPLRDLDYLTESEKNKMLAEWNDTGISYSNEQYVNELFEAQVKRTPNKAAIIFDDKELTYKQLDALANQLAHLIIHFGVKRDDLVGVAIKPSLDLVVSMLAIFKAGAGYMPLDPSLPKARIAHMCSEAKLRSIITHTGVLEDGLVANCQSILLDNNETLNELLKCPEHVPCLGY